MQIISTPQVYADLWGEESQRFEELGLYSELTRYLELHSPNGKILEFGCGTGLATRKLAENHEILSLDNNIVLLEKARTNLESNSDKVQIHQCDFFAFTEKDKKIIQDFAPDVVIGWNIGTSGQGQEERASKNLKLLDKAKDYREKVEDIIMEISSALESVQIVNLVHRTQLRAGFGFKEAEQAQLVNYDQYVFDINVDSKFKGKSAKAIEWDDIDSKIGYVFQNSDSNGTPILISVIAERKKK